jgi:Ca2+-binding EF-hand superfamily protein
MKKLVIAATALLAGTAFAQTPPAAAPAPVAPLADQVTTRNEVVAKVREHFGRMDADRNGSITSQEVMAGRTQLAERMKSRRLDHGEGSAPHVMVHKGPRGDANAAFDRLDADKNGWIGRDEFAKAREQRIERRIVKRDKANAPRGGKEVRRHVRRMHGPGGFGARMIVMADTNSDGQITLSEAETLALQHFDQMDSNRDGQVTREERRAARPALINRMRQEKKNGS